DGVKYYLSEQRSVEGQAFGYSVLCLKDWLSADHANLKRHFEHLSKLGPVEPTEPYIYGFYIASHLFHADIFKTDPHQILAAAYKVHFEWKRSKKQQYLSKSFEYILAMALVMTRHYKDALYYINEAILICPTPNTQLEQYAYRRLMLFKAIAFAQSRINDEAEKLFKQIQPSQFYFLSKKMDTILYLSMGSYLKGTNNKLEEKLQDLIVETGFLRLKEVLVNSQSHLLLESYCERN
ncbi:MAG TPA: hypothetical protein VD794_17135, partial [Flavisolibacter sp.]|nr:hypothetical protein [Flavisolibacter sp.]